MEHNDTQSDINIVALWLRKDPSRWLAGVLAGIFSCIIMLCFSALLSFVFGKDPLLAVKLIGIPVIGAQALAIGFHLKAIVVGFVLWFLLCGFLGFIYAHFTQTNSLTALVGVGITWGAFSWIFIYNLFSNSFRELMVSKPSAGVAFLVCMVFGLSLTSVAFFHRMLGAKN